MSATEKLQFTLQWLWLTSPTHTHTLDNRNINAVQRSACVSRNKDELMYDYLASITCSSSGPLDKCKQHSIDLQTAVSHQVNTAMHCVHSNVQITGTILTASSTTDALLTFEMSSQLIFIVVGLGGGVGRYTVLTIMIMPEMKLWHTCYKWFKSIFWKIGQHWKTIMMIWVLP